MNQSLYSIDDAAAELSLTPQRVRTLCREGKLPSQKVGKSWVIQPSDLQAYQQQHHNCKMMVAEDRARYTVSSSRKPAVLSFFSGAMGLDLGLERAGFETLLACEIDPVCRQTIIANKPDIALLSDLRDYTAQEIMEAAGLQLHQNEVDLIVGGPPCQAFSTAGKRRAFQDERGNVFLKYIDLALEIQPKYLVIENVRGLLSAPLEHRPHNQRGEGFPPLTRDELPGGALLHILETIRAKGYSTTFNLYNAANFGSPQSRERVVIICACDGRPVPYLTPTHANDVRYNLPAWRTFRQAVADLDEAEMDAVSFPEKRLQYYRLLGPGQNWRNLPKSLQKEALGKSYDAGGGKTGFLRRLAWDKPAPTLVTYPAMPATDLAHPEADRPLSIQEYKRIQEFPDHWLICGNLRDQYRQVGNAVPVSLGQAIGYTILMHMQHQAPPEFPGFRYSRYLGTDETSWENNVRQTDLKQQHKTNSLQMALPLG